MLLVAFSRRMCCSRVDSVSTKLRRPSASTVSPASRPGICRTCLRRVGEQADIGAAEIERVADRLAFADDDVGAHLAGRAHGAERNRFGEDGDQQRALGVGGGGDRREVAQIAEEVRASARHAARRIVDLGARCPPRARTSSGSRTISSPAISRERRGDVGILRMQPAGEHRLLAGASRDAPSASPRRRRSSRRTSRRWRPPCRSARRPASGIRTAPAACPARFRADRACSSSGIPSAGSGDRRSREHGGDRRRRRGRTAPSRPRRCAPPSSPARARPRVRSCAPGMSSSPDNRLSAGMSANSASMSAAPTRASIRARSEASSGR